jgi:hypothetical protein
MGSRILRSSGRTPGGVVRFGQIDAARDGAVIVT